jgi:protein disulfide-isomerase
MSSPNPVSLGSRDKPGRFWKRFWLTFLVASLAYAWYSFYVPSDRIAWVKDFATAKQHAVESDKPIILFFTGKWCVPCRIMKREVWADDLVADRVNAAFIPVTIDVDDSGAVSTLSRYGIRATPITIITDSKGDVLRQKQGGLSKADFLEMLSR